MPVFFNNSLIPSFMTPTFTTDIRHSILLVNVYFDSCHVFVSCRCSKEDETVPSTSTATGPVTRKDSATWKANFGSMRQRIGTSLIYQKQSLYFSRAYISVNEILHDKKHALKSTVTIVVLFKQNTKHHNLANDKLMRF